MLRLAFILLFMKFQLVAEFLFFSHQVDQVVMGCSISQPFKMTLSRKRFANSLLSDFTV